MASTSELWVRMRRRHTVRVAIAYLVAAWVVIEVSEVVLPAIGVPGWGVRAVILLLVVGIVPAAALGWAFDRGPAESPARPAPAERAGDGARDAAAAAARPAADPRSIAVLPFVNFSGEAENEYFSDGMTEELIDRLVKVRGLRVAARTSCFAFKGRNADIAEIARQLRVSYVLEGSVRRAADRLRVTAQLIDAASGFHVWSETYERVPADVFAIQDEIGAAIIAALRAPLGAGEAGEEPPHVGRRRPSSVHAYDLYLQGRYLLNRRSSASVREAMERLQLALACDPGYAPAHAALAECYLVLASGTYAVMAPRDALARATASAEKALSLDSRLADAYVAVGLAKLYGWDWEASAALLEGATRLDPGSAAAHHHHAWRLALTREFDAALAGIERALELDPLAVPVRVARARVLQFMRRPEQAVAYLRRTLELDPASGAALLSLGLALLQSGAPREGLETLRRARELSDSPATAGLVAYALGAAGEQAEGERLARELIERAQRQYVSPVTIGGAYTGLGRPGEALDWYERAYAERSPGLIYLAVEPLLDPLRGEPRFQSLLDRVGLAMLPAA